MQLESQPASAAVRPEAAVLKFRLSDQSRLESRLSEIRQRRLLCASASSAMLGTFGFLTAMLAWLWVDVVLDLPPILRMTAWCFAGLVLVVVGGRRLLRAVRETRAIHIAGDLDRMTRSGGQIRSGFDLIAHRSPSAPQFVPQAASAFLTAGLTDLAVRRAAVLASSTPPHLTAPLKPVLHSACLPCAAGLGLIGLGMIFPRMAEVEARRFFDPWGDQPAWSQYEFIVDPAGADVIYGEPLDISVAVSGPVVDQLELVLIPPDAADIRDVEEIAPLEILPMFREVSGRWHTSIARVTEPSRFFVRARRARSRTFPIRVITVPRIELVEVEIDWPLYTGVSTFRGRMPVSGIAALPDSVVRVSLTSNRPLSGGTLLLVSEHSPTTESEDGAEEAPEEFREPLSVTADPHQVTGQFTVKAGGRLDLHVTDEAGQSSVEPWSVPLRLLIDERPLVRVLQPRQTSFATPSAVVPVVVSAEDDFGIRRIQLFRSLNNSRFLPTNLTLPNTALRRAEGTMVLPLPVYDVQAGDEIRLFARAEDNDPHGPDAPAGKGTESSIVTIRVISEEDLQRVQQQRAGMELMMSRQQQVQRRLETLAEQIRKLTEQLQAAEPDSAAAEEIREKLQELARQLTENAAALQKLAKTPLPLDLDQQLAPKLGELSEMLQRLSEEAAGAAADTKMTAEQIRELLQKQLETIQKARGEHREEALRPMEQLAQVLPLKQDEAAFGQLVQRQRDLARRLESLQGANDRSDPATRARIRELEDEQHQIREQLKDLMDRIEEHISQLPDDPELDELRLSARQFADALRSSGAAEAMSDAEQSLSRFEGLSGQQHADRAATLLEQLLSQCEGMGTEAAQCLPRFNPALGDSMARTLQQLAPGMTPGSNGMPGMSGSGGGYSTRTSSMDNVGLYGGLPLLDQSLSGSGDTTAQEVAGSAHRRNSETGRAGEAEFGPGQTNAIQGGSSSGVPAEYRRQTGRYLQQLAEELER